MNKHYKLGIYRVHEEPEELKLDSLEIISFLSKVFQMVFQERRR